MPRSLEQAVEQVAKRVANSGIAAVSSTLDVLLGSNQFVVAKMEDARVVVIDKCHWPASTKAITNHVATALLREDK